MCLAGCQSRTPTLLRRPETTPPLNDAKFVTVRTGVGSPSRPRRQDQNSPCRNAHNDSASNTHCPLLCHQHTAHNPNPKPPQRRITTHGARGREHCSVGDPRRRRRLITRNASPRRGQPIELSTYLRDSLSSDRPIDLHISMPTYPCDYRSVCLSACRFAYLLVCVMTLLYSAVCCHGHIHA